MVYSLSYKRPRHHDGSSQSSLNGNEKQESIDESIQSASTCSMCGGIPEALSFDRIISGGTCPPCTIRDFLNYSKYIEQNAENLQFFLWYRAYCKKWDELPKSKQELSKEWAPTYIDMEKAPIQVSPDTAAALQGTGLEAAPQQIESDRYDPFDTPPRTPSDETARGTPSEVSTSDEKSSGWSSQNTAETVSRKQGEVFNDAGLRQPFTIQPYRDEIARIITIYIADGGARQLNLSARERQALLHALEKTTHPSAFRDVATTVEWSLRCQAHPNFIRWTICNGNRPRVIFARGLGVAVIILGILVDLLLTLSGANRGWRAIALLLYFVGIATLIAGWKGMCVVLHGLHHRHLRPWELFQDEDDATVQLDNVSNLTLESNNSYEDEPWVARYEKRNIIRKVLDRQRWVEEPALRQIQDTIFVQSCIAGLVGGVILTAIFLAVPAGHFY